MTANTGREVVVHVDRVDAGRLRFGCVPPRPPLLHAVPGREVGLHAQSSHPPPERVKSNPLRTPADAGGADAAPGRTWNGGPASIPRP